MSRILGLDLGTNSIGWAVVDFDTQQIIDTGVRVFPEGINRDSGREVSKNATRREARQMRRQHFRTRMRKKYLLDTLKKQGLCPKENKAFEQWISKDPYELRLRALDEEVSLDDLGRIFYHFSQRRGFKSNRKAGKEDSAIFKGSSKTDTISINETKEELNQGYRTLGELLYNLNPHEERRRNRYTTRQMYVDEFNKIWDKQKQYHPGVLTEELKHKIGHPEEGLLFYQRPLRSQKHLLGKCTFESYWFYDKYSNPNRWVEKGKPVCSVSNPEYELFRAWQFANTIKYDKDKPLTNEQRGKVVEIINSKDKRFEFQKIKKALGMENELFNYENSHKVFGNKTHAKLSKLFLKEIWEQNKNDIWHCFFSYDKNEKLVEKLKRSYGLKEKDAKKVENIHLDQDYSRLSLKAIRNILPFLKEGYLYDEAVLLGGVKNAFGKQWENLSEEQHKFIRDNVESISAGKYKEGELIEKLREFLTQQFNLKNKQLSKLYHHSQIDHKDGSDSKLDPPPEIRNPIVQKALNETKRVVNAIINEYGKPGEIRVEMARELKQSKEARERQRLEKSQREEKNDEVRKVLDEYGLAHSRNNRHKYLLWEESQGVCPYTGKQIGIEDLFSDNQFQVEHIIPYSISLDDSFMNKTICEAKENQLKGNQTPYQFYKDNPGKWEEVKERAKTLLAPNNFRKYQRFISDQDYKLDDFIERQLNDTRYISKAARDYLKSVCPKVYVTQGEVTNQLRHLWGLNAILQLPKKTSEVREGHYWAALDEHGEIKEMERWGFEKRKEVPQKLAKKGELVYGFVKGGQFIPQKQREDHRHHAIDALAAACSKASFLKELSNATKKDKGYRYEDFPQPWESFYNEAWSAISNILVSFSANRKVTDTIKKTIKKNGKKYKSKGLAARGELHEQTIYGKHKNKEGKDYYHLRKPLEKITQKKHVDEIVDSRIKSAIEQKLVDKGIDISKKYKFGSDLLFEKDPQTGEKITSIYLPNRNGNPVPVKKVRVRKPFSNIRNLKPKSGINQYVEPGNNHHMLIYRNSKGEIDYQLVTFWEAVQRKKNNQPVFDTKMTEGNELIEFLQRDDLFLLGINDEDIDWDNPNEKFLSDHLYRVQKITSTGYKIVFRHHLASTIDNINQMIGIASLKNWDSYNPIKVSIDILGNIYRQ
jgi:CRISPR-associated endonuclease Csn1